MGKTIEKQEVHWHACSDTDVIQNLESCKEGLSHEEASLRLKKFGLNRLSVKSNKSIILIMLRQLNNPLIYILLASSILAILLGKTTDALVVLSVVILNTLIGFIQEYRSSRTIQALLEMIPQTSSVIRDGIISSIPSAQIVPGDILTLQGGDRVAADVRLFSVKNLGCDESALTGESIPVLKTIEPTSVEATIADRKCMVYNGTLVTSGTAIGIVVATGIQTEFGKISQLLEQVTPLETPLTKTLKRLASLITSIVFILGIGLFTFGYFRGYSLLDAGIASIALAVAAIPEGLPATITIAAAIGVRRMARRKAIIRHLLAVETLGSTTVICTDKTGTLTQNEMTVQSIWTPIKSFFVTGVGYSPEGKILIQNSGSPEELTDENIVDELLQAAMLCNDATIQQRESKWIPYGDPTELALIVAGRKRGLNESKLRLEYPKIDVLPFDSDKRIMATLNHTPLNGKTIFLKGAPEVVIGLSELDSKGKSLDSESFIYKQVAEMANQGMRVIAVAKKTVDSDCSSIKEDDIKNDFILLGLLGMIDPPREEVSEAIKACQKAGITVKMITGDHPLTASVIGVELALEGNGKVITGEELNQLNAKELNEVINQNNIFARALPEHKLKIVEALQACGHVVAMTGDGVNDAPALKRANIGVAMGISGTAVAKEASDMVLADDNFTSIKAAVEEGRRVYDNLIKSIAFIFPTSLAQALVILVAIVFFPIEANIMILPIQPVQILWINLVVAVALALSLAFEAMEPDIMDRAPRKPDAPILSKFMVFRTLTVGTIMAAGTIGLFFWEYTIELAKGIPEKTVLAEAQTMSVTSLMFFQIFYLLNCRSFRFSIFRMGFFSNPYVLLGIGFVILAQIGFVYLPFMNTLFSSSPINFESWIISVAIAASISLIIAFEKWVFKRFSKT
jgi:magnesium-transporting ATPase (P-type)